jgi:hypothetical protein
MLRLIALLATLASPAYAGPPDRISILAGSHHVGVRGFEEVNPGVFLTWERPRVDLSVGAYRNSYGRLSIAALAAVPIWSRGETEVSLFGGLTHYPGNGRNFAIHAGDVVAIGGLQLRHENLFVQVLPGGGSMPVVIAAGVTFSLRR